MFKHPHPCPSLRSRVRSWRPSRLSGCWTQHTCLRSHRRWVYYGGSQFWRLSAAGSWQCNTSRGPMNVYHCSLENPAMWLQYFEVQRCLRGFFHVLSIICKEERSIAWICITSNPQLANSLGLFVSQRGVENKAEVQAYTVRTPKKNAPHQNWAKLFED